MKAPASGEEDLLDGVGAEDGGEADREERRDHDQEDERAEIGREDPVQRDRDGVAGEDVLPLRPLRVGEAGGSSTRRTPSLLVCTIMRTIAAMSDPTEIVVIVFQRLWNQPLRSQPRRFAAAPITTTISAHMTRRSQSGRGFVVGADPSCAAEVISLS